MNRFTIRKILFLIICLLMVLAVHLSLAQDTTSTPIISATPSAYPMPTWIVTPAYNVSNIDELPTFAALFNKSNCAPPCFWGLKVGQSTADDVFDVLYQSKFLKNLEEGAPFYLNRTNEFITQGILFNFTSGFGYPTTQVSFIVDHQILKSVSLSESGAVDWLSDKSSTLSLAEILKRIEVTPEIYVYDQSDKGGFFTNNVTMMFIYRKLGILLVYQFDFSREFDEKKDPQFTICPTIDHVIRLNWWFWDPNEDSSHFGVYSSASPLPSPANKKGYISIEKFFRTDAKSFVEYFRDSSNKCLVTQFLK
ncbi:MAG: hypothetical protein H0X30_09390 [Anaerolineae bacterium]|nr:hypothetical protein [Anaerolineae bacterium]